MQFFSLFRKFAFQFHSMDKFNGIYRIDSARLKTWDYSWPGMYYITINTKHGKHYFGEIKNEEMILNELGKVVQEEWLKTVEIRKTMNLELGEFVVMPNHFHCILIIHPNKFNSLNKEIYDA